MSQAEIAGGALTPEDEFPSKGRLLRNCSLKSAQGGQVQLTDFRGRSNLVLIFADEGTACPKLLSDLAARYTDIKDQQAEVLAIISSAAELAGAEILQPFPVLVDEGGRVHLQVGATTSDGHPSAAVYITDRFAEVFAAYRMRDGQSLPSAEDIIGWLEFVNSQCPECDAPEWPS